MTTIDKQKTVTQILQDHILMERISEAMFTINNVVRPNELDNGFYPIYSYHGISTAFNIIGISDDEELCERLTDLFTEGNKSTENAIALSRSIYDKWLEEIKNYFVEKSNAKLVV